MKSNLTGNEPENFDHTIESFVNEIMKQTYKASSFKISWTGGEDENSLVLGSGRPFIVKSNIHSLNFRQKELFFSNGIEIDFEKIDPSDIERIYKYKQVVKVLLRLAKEPDIDMDFTGKVSSLVGNVQFVIKNKTVTRKIYGAKILSRRNKDIELLLQLDNGIPIKQFIGGKDPIEPCLSDAMGVRCEFIYFDIIKFT